MSGSVWCHVLLVALIAGPASALRLEVAAAHLSRRNVASLAAVATSAAISHPALAERNVITKEEAAEMKANMISRYAKPGEETEESLANQEKRRQLYAAIKAKAEAFEAKVVTVEKSVTDADKFTEAADALAVYILGEQRIPEGVKVKDIVKRLRIAFNKLPQKKVKCGADVRPGTTCTSPGKAAEDSYTSLVEVVRKSAIVPPGFTEAF